MRLKMTHSSSLFKSFLEVGFHTNFKQTLVMKLIFLCIYAISYQVSPFASATSLNYIILCTCLFTFIHYHSGYI